MDIVKSAQDASAYLMAQRRYFHQHPEMGPAEQLQTLASIEAELDAMGIPFVRVPGGGTLGFLNQGAQGKAVLLRSDVDALPIQEDPCNLKGAKTAVSQMPGVMHACGHDGHIAMLLTQAKLLKAMEDQLSGPVILMFEQGEEGYLNVEPLCLYLQESDIHVDTCYATHVCWDLDAGKIACPQGTALSGIYAFHADLTGLGGHGSRPDLAHSTLDCFVAVYEALQALRMKYIHPQNCLTWSLGKVIAGTAHNVIPEHLHMAGTVRFMDLESAETFWGELKRILTQICPLYYCDYTLVRELFFAPTINDDTCHDVFCQSTQDLLGGDTLASWGPWMASESFSYLTSMYPSVNTFTGIRNQDMGTGANHHTPQFDMDDTCLWKAVAAAVGYVVAFQTQEPDTGAFSSLCADMKTLVKWLHEE